MPYLIGVAGHVGNMQNWFNGVDYALALWERNNVIKPDGNAGYLFSYTGSEFYYSEGVDHFFGGPKIEEEPLSLAVEGDRYMIFGYAAESRSRALGQTENGRFSGWNLETPVSLGGMGYDRRHYSHSREFRSNIVAEWNFWQKVIEKCEF